MEMRRTITACDSLRPVALLTRLSSKEHSEPGGPGMRERASSMVTDRNLARGSGAAGGVDRQDLHSTRGREADADTDAYVGGGGLSGRWRGGCM